MMISVPTLWVLIAFPLLLQTAFAQSFQPCPILGPRFPRPSDLANDDVIRSALQNTTTAFDEIVATGNSTYGTTTPDTTSFSIAFFSSNDVLNASHPLLFEYHYTAPTLKVAKVGAAELDSGSIFRIGSMTEVFTVWTFLIQAGEAHWVDSVTKYVPELANQHQNRSSFGGYSWKDVTLGDLAGHLSGVPRDYGIADLGAQGASVVSGSSPATPLTCLQPSCTREKFFNDLLGRYPVYLPGTTPIMLDTAFQLLAYALEGIKKTPFTRLFNETTQAAKMTSTTLRHAASSKNAVIPGDNETSCGWSTDLGDEAPALSMYSTITDIGLAGIAMLNSTFMPSAMTRRWLKPIAHTSNLVNAVGRPWIIYKATADQSPINPVIEIFTSYGSIGKYSSYIGLVPDYNVGFTILAADQNSAPDLNVHADVIADNLLPALEEAAIYQAARNFAGSYNSSTSNGFMVVETPDGLAGLSLANLTIGSTDVRAELAQLNNIDPTALSMRLYPTDLKENAPSGLTRMAFRAVFQDENATVDAGTPTCITWMGVDALNFNGLPLDLLIFTLKGGAVVSVEFPALGVTMDRVGGD